MTVIIALLGPAGSGKSFGALLLAKGLGGRIAVIDTEAGSGDLYAAKFDYDILQIYLRVMHPRQRMGHRAEQVRVARQGQVAVRALPQDLGRGERERAPTFILIERLLVPGEFVQQPLHRLRQAF